MATTEDGLELMVQAVAQCPIARQSDLSPIQLPRSVRPLRLLDGRISTDGECPL